MEKSQIQEISLYAKAGVPLAKTASGLFLPFPITNAGCYPTILQAGSAVVGKVGLDPANNLVQLSGRIPALAFVEEIIISANTEVLNGATYESSNKTLGGYRYINAYFRLESNAVGAVTCSIVYKAPAQYVSDIATIVSGANYQTISDKLIKANNVAFRVTNSSGANININKLNYFAQ